MNKKGGELPINEFYKVLQYCTISKSSKWWSVIALIQSRNRIEIGLYLWKKKNEEWKRKHKFTIASKEELKDILPIMKKYSDYLQE